MRAKSTTVTKSLGVCAGLRSMVCESNVGCASEALGSEDLRPPTSDLGPCQSLVVERTCFEGLRSNTACRLCHSHSSAHSLCHRSTYYHHTSKNMSASKPCVYLTVIVHSCVLLDLVQSLLLVLFQWLLLEPSLTNRKIPGPKSQQPLQVHSLDSFQSLHSRWHPGG